MTRTIEAFFRHSTLNLRVFYLAVLGLGAPLSGPPGRFAIQILAMNEILAVNVDQP